MEGSEMKTLFREELATTIKDSDHPGTRGRAEIAKELLKREPAFLSVNPVQYCKSCVLHDSVTRVVDEDENAILSRFRKPNGALS